MCTNRRSATKLIVPPSTAHDTTFPNIYIYPWGDYQTYIVVFNHTRHWFGISTQLFYLICGSTIARRCFAIHYLVGIAKYFAMNCNLFNFPFDDPST